MASLSEELRAISLRCTCQHVLQVEAMETGMAEELQREAEARSAALVEGGGSDKAVQEAGPALVLAEADGNDSSAGQRCSPSAPCHAQRKHPAAHATMGAMQSCTTAVFLCCYGLGSA